ncbi:MAG TPA: hypothetical protein VL095_16590 [Flavisolibacter sp.]|nr:hypothetical protein [Flavisolibacter sp.]
MQKSILYIASTLDEVYECAYSILKYLEIYNLKPPTSHSLVVYTNYPDLLEAYGSFFNQFQFRPLPANADKRSIVEQFKKEAGGDVFYFDSNTYPVRQIDDEKSIQSYKDLKEFKVLLKDFFGRYQEESVPNQVKLIHNVDAKEIEIQKKKFDDLPITSKWLRKIMGRGWNIYKYQVKI